MNAWGARTTWTPSRSQLRRTQVANLPICLQYACLPPAAACCLILATTASPSLFCDSSTCKCRESHHGGCMHLACLRCAADSARQADMCVRRGSADNLRYTTPQSFVAGELEQIAAGIIMMLTVYELLTEQSKLAHLLSIWPLAARDCEVCGIKRLIKHKSVVARCKRVHESGGAASWPRPDVQQNHECLLADRARLA